MIRDHILDTELAETPIGKVHLHLAVLAPPSGLATDGGAWGIPRRHADTMLTITGDQGRLKTGAEQFGKAADVATDSGGRRSDAELVAAQRATVPTAGNHSLQPLRNRLQHEIADRVAEHVVNLLKSVETDHKQRHFAAFDCGLRNHRSQFEVEGVAVDQAGQ